MGDPDKRESKESAQLTPLSPPIDRTAQTAQSAPEEGPGGGSTPVNHHEPLLRLAWLGTPSGISCLVIAAFVVAGSYARLSALGTVSIWNDEAQSTIYALSILQHGYPVIVSQHLVNNWEPAYPYLEAASIALLGHSNFAYRIPAALLGISLIPLSYWIGMRFRDRYVGIALAAMVAFSTEYIAWSRQARWYMLFVLLLALGFLAILIWSQVQTRWARRLCLVAVAGTGAALSVTSIGLFLLYCPGILVGLLAFLIAARWTRIRRFFTGLDRPEDASGRQTRPTIPYRFRLPIVGLAVLSIAVLTLVEAPALSVLATALVTRAFGFAPYPLVYSTGFGTYLVDFYPGIVVLSGGSIYFIARRRNPVEIGLLAFCGAAFVSISVFGSLTNNIAGGQPPIIHHLVPLLFFLFLLSAVTIVGVIRWALTAMDHRWPTRSQLRRATPALFGAAVVVMLVIPSTVVPTNNVLNTFRTATPMDSFIPWVAFSLDPKYPWVLYQIQQSNYQLASDYVLAHRVPGEVVAATNTAPPSVYLGSVQYYIRGNAIPSWLIYVNGQPEFYQTGARLVANTSQLEGLLYNSSGWFISDAVIGNTRVFPGEMYLAVEYFMTAIPGGTDSSIWLYHWNRSTPTGLVGALIHAVPHLNSSVAKYSLQGQLGWAVTRGVTSDGNRPVLIPIAPYLLPLIKNVTTRGHGVLFNVYNNRPDLQAQFPEVAAPPYNNTRLNEWGCEVASGTLPDPAYATLAPYANLYCA